MDWTKQLFSWLGYGIFEASPTPVGDGQVRKLLIDSIGRLQVALGAPPVGQRVTALLPGKAGLLKGSAGQLVELTVWNRAASGCWLQIHDSALAPSGGATPVDQIYLPPQSAFGWRPVGALACTHAIRWAASSTAGTLTLIGDDDVGLTAGVL